MTAPDPVAACRAALARNPRDRSALIALGRLRLAAGHPAEAAALLSEAMLIAPDAATLNDLGGALTAIGHRTEAEQRLRQAVALDPGFVLAWLNLGLLHLAAGQPDPAVAALRHALELTPDDATVRQALGDALLMRGNAAAAADDPAGAERHFRDALAVRPDFVAALGNLGNVLVRQLRLPEALDAYRSGLALAPDNANLAFACALALLLDGQDAAGWQLYEARRRVDPMRWNYERRTAPPLWTPDVSLHRRRVLLTAEQGAGDMIQALRYVPRLAACADSVVLELPAALHRLARDLPGVAGCIDLGEPAPACDIACPLLSLPLLFGTGADSIPAPIPYLAPPEDAAARWAAWWGPDGGGRRIGIVCSGDPRHPYDRMRSIPLSRLAPLRRHREARFVLVQTDLRPTDAEARDAWRGLRFPSVALADFADTAGLLAQLDLVITVDTAVAHLAGAMGKPAWVLLAHCPDWRWRLERTDSPWYPTLRLFRQPAPGDWDAVIAAVDAALGSGGAAG